MADKIPLDEKESENPYRFNALPVTEIAAFS